MTGRPAPLGQRHARKTHTHSCAICSLSYFQRTGLLDGRRSAARSTIGGAAPVRRDTRATKLNTHHSLMFALSLQFRNDWFAERQERRWFNDMSVHENKPIFAISLSV